MNIVNFNRVQAPSSLRKPLALGLLSLSLFMTACSVTVPPEEIIEEPDPIVTERTVTVNTGSRTLTPILVSGDRELQCAIFCVSPKITVSASLSVTQGSTAVSSRLSMVAEENGASSKFSGSSSKVVYTAPEGWTIVSILSSRSHSRSYIDDDHSIDTFTYGTGELVKQYRVVGDNSGEDLGKTRVTASYHPIKIKIKKVD